MLKNFAFCFLAAAAFLPLTSAKVLAADAEASFHTAQSAPEKTLNDIVRHSEADEDMSVYVLKIPGFDPKKSEEYSHLFTEDLLKSMAAVQTKLVRQDCDSNYSNGDICGVDGNPITCAQDVSNQDYLYQTKMEDEQKAVIARRWADPALPGNDPVYRLVKSGNDWKIDGITCTADLKFNMD